MPESNPWLETLCNLGAAACEGMLAARTAAREHHNAGPGAAPDAEVPIPPSWRVRRPSERAVAGPRETTPPPSTANATTPPAPPTKSASAATAPGEAQPPAPTKLELVYTGTLTPWNGSAPPASPPASTLAGPRHTASSGPPVATTPGVAATVASGGAETRTHPAHVATTPTSEPQLELDFSPRPTLPAASAQPTSAVPDEPHLGALLASVVRVLDDVVGQAVGQGLAEALAKLEQSHARDLTVLVERFDAALERQDARMCSLLERQDARMRELLASQAATHAEELRTALQAMQAERSAQTEAPGEHATVSEALAQLQEALRLGFGELRGVLKQNNRELMKLRTELAPSLAALALARKPEPEALRRPLPGDGCPPPAPQPRASPVRSPPVREDLAASQRRLDAAHEGDDEDDIEDPEEPRRRSLRYPKPDDADVDTFHAQEASP